jgi:hypothetical protein
MELLFYSVIEQQEKKEVVHTTKPLYSEALHTLINKDNVGI